MLNFSVESLNKREDKLMHDTGPALQSPIKVIVYTERIPVLSQLELRTVVPIVNT